MNVLVDFPQEVLDGFDAQLAKRLDAWVAGRQAMRAPTEAELREATRVGEEAGSARKANDHLAKLVAARAVPRPTRRSLILEASRAWLAAQAAEKK